MKASRLSSRRNRQLIEKTRKKSFKNEARLHSPPHLELFQKEDCPSSHAVRSRLSSMGVDYIVHNVTHPLSIKNAQTLLAQNKPVEIPVLLDRKTGAKIHGSRPILDYLTKEYGLPKSTPIGNWLNELNTRIRERTDELTWALRTPRDRFRVLADDVSESWKSIQNSYRTIRNAVREPANKRRAA